MFFCSVTQISCDVFCCFSCLSLSCHRGLNKYYGDADISAKLAEDVLNVLIVSRRVRSRMVGPRAIMGGIATFFFSFFLKSHL